MPVATASAPPGFDLIWEAKRWRQAGRARAPEISVEERGEHQHRTRDSQLSKLFTFGHCRDPEAPGVKSLERCPNRTHTETICVGLYHWQERNARASRHRGSITLQRAQVDLDQGAI